MSQTVPCETFDNLAASGWFVGGFLFCAVITGAFVLVAVRTFVREEPTDDEG